MTRLNPGLLGLALAPALTLAGAGCAPNPPMGAASATAPAASARQCFSAANVNGFRLVDDRTVDLTVGASRVFRAELLGTCPDVRNAVGLGVRTRAGSSFVCEDLDVELVVPGSLGPRVCPVTALRMRTPAEMEAERARR